VPCFFCYFFCPLVFSGGLYALPDVRKVLFSSKIFWEIDAVIFSFVFDKYCLIID